MSSENIEALKRSIDAYNRRDVDALLDALDPEVEWHSGILESLAGDATVYRGHEGVRRLFRELDDVLVEIHGESSEIRDLEDRTVLLGRFRTRGKASGVESVSPAGMVTEWKNGKAVRVRTFLSHAEALEAAGLKE
jgi:ketosteroid isomerase-like protein